MIRRDGRYPAGLMTVSLALVACSAVFGQTNPAALTPPFTQGWGSTTFTTMPAGFAAWNGLSGGTVNTQAKAEASVPGGDVTTIRTITPNDGGAGGCYGYTAGSDARFGILTSSNTGEGVDQLAMAINASGLSDINITYDIINVVANVRTVGSVCQYRVGNSGSWTTLTGTNNPYVQSGGTAGTVTTVSLTLPPAADDQPYVEIRWATWRGSGSGNSSGYAIDNINVGGDGGCLITDLTLSGGPNYSISDTATATVTLNQAPDTTATVNVSSGAFSTVPITINAPATTGQALVTMINAGTFTAQANGGSGAGGNAISSSFTVSGGNAASFAATGINTIDDSAGNSNGYLDPGESAIKLSFQITNNGTLNASGVSGVLNSLTSNATVTTSTQNYPDLAIGAGGTNASPFQISVSPAQVCGYPINLQLTVTSSQGSSSFPISLASCAPNHTQFDPPSDYYATVTATDATLKAQLHNIISRDYWNGFLSSPDHKVHSYDDARFGLQLTDLDVNDQAHVILIYNGLSVPKQWDGGVTWNREHQWPDSLGINGALPAYGDMHHLRPCTPSVNSSRGNDGYGIGGGFWDPDHGSPDRGRSARTIFYMNTRYNGTAPDAAQNLVLVNGQPSGNQMGDLATLFQWHYAYPIDERERRRNYVVFSNVANPTYYQGNRNPYIDHPEYVWAIYGSGLNDSTLYVGGAPNGDGSSSANVNLGAIIVGATMPAAQNVTLNKTGTAPTTYNVNLTGAAVSNAAGSRQSFIPGTQSRTITAGLGGAAAPAGIKSGTITIDNTDLTSAAAGEGSADGDDSVSISLTVLNHANGSFSSPSDANTLTIDFGDVTLGSSPVTHGFSIYNLVATPGYTARLDLDSVGGSGDTSRLYTDLAPFSNLDAGNSAAFTATFDPAATGTFSAIYTLQNSDENLAGATNGANLVLTLMGRGVQPACPTVSGDMNGDGLVNGKDIQGFIVCLFSSGGPTCPCADTNHDQLVTTTDISSFVALLLGP